MVARYNFGLGNVGSYQVSGKPYLTSSLTVPASSSAPLEIPFNTVTKTITITNTLSSAVPNVPLRFGFSANGVKGVENNNYAVLNNGESFEADYKVIKIFLLSDSGSECSASVCVGLTGIAAEHLVNNWSGSAGVG